MSTKALKMLLSRVAKESAQQGLENPALKSTANSLKFNKYGYGSGSPLKGNPATKTKGASSNIYSPNL